MNGNRRNINQNLLFGIILSTTLIASCNPEINKFVDDPAETHPPLSVQTSTATLIPTKLGTPTIVPTATPVPTYTSTVPPTTTLTPSPTPLGGGTGFIYFIACKVWFGECGLYKLNLIDGSLLPVLSTDENVIGYLFSPDQSKVLIVTGPYTDEMGNYPRYDLFVWDITSRKEFSVVRSIYPTDIKWSPDGSKVACIALFEVDDQNIEWRRLYVVNSDGSSKISVTGEVTAYDNWFLWTLDSQRILFSGGIPMKILEIKGDQKIMEALDGSEDPYWASLYLVNADGSDLTKVTPEKTRGFWYFDWVDDGHKVLANTNLCPFAGCGQNYVRIIDLDNGNLFQIDPEEKSIDWAILSPDKAHYISWCTYFSCNITLNSLDNSENQQYGRGIYWDTRDSTKNLPIWSPDGHYTALVAFSDSQDWRRATSALFVSDTTNLNISNRITSWLLRPPATVYDWYWSWSPDSQFIVYSTPGKPTLYLQSLADLIKPDPQVLYESVDIEAIGPIYWQP